MLPGFDEALDFSEQHNLESDLCCAIFYLSTTKEIRKNLMLSSCIISFKKDGKIFHKSHVCFIHNNKILECNPFYYSKDVFIVDYANFGSWKDIYKPTEIDQTVILADVLYTRNKIMFYLSLKRNELIDALAKDINCDQIELQNFGINLSKDQISVQVLKL